MLQQNRAAKLESGRQSNQEMKNQPEENGLARSFQNGQFDWTRNMKS